MPHSDIALTSIYQRPDRLKLLYNLLAERESTQNISHKAPPSWEDHVRFVESRPYEVWLFIEAAGGIVGACYVTKRNEIGIGIFKEHQGKGYAVRALERLKAIHKPLPAIPAERVEQFLANINPSNTRSIALFEKMGFKLVQLTYALEAPFKS